MTHADALKIAHEIHGLTIMLLDIVIVIASGALALWFRR